MLGGPAGRGADRADAVAERLGGRADRDLADVAGADRVVAGRAVVAAGVRDDVVVAAALGDAAGGGAVAAQVDRAGRGRCAPLDDSTDRSPWVNVSPPAVAVASFEWRAEVVPTPDVALPALDTGSATGASAKLPDSTESWPEVELLPPASAVCSIELSTRVRPPPVRALSPVATGPANAGWTVLPASVLASPEVVDHIGVPYELTRVSPASEEARFSASVSAVPAAATPLPLTATIVASGVPRTLPPPVLRSPVVLSEPPAAVLFDVEASVCELPPAATALSVTWTGKAPWTAAMLPDSEPSWPEVLTSPPATARCSDEPRDSALASAATALPSAWGETAAAACATLPAKVPYEPSALTSPASVTDREQSRSM